MSVDPKRGPESFREPQPPQFTIIAKRAKTTLEEAALDSLATLAGNEAPQELHKSKFQQIPPENLGDPFTNGQIVNWIWTEGGTCNYAKEPYKDGSVYEGMFRNNLPHGPGKLRAVNGNVFHGNWVNGQLEGRVRVYFPDGAYMEMNYLHGIPVGQVTFTYPGINFSFSHEIK